MRVPGELVRMIANSIRTCTALSHHYFLARSFLLFLGIVSFHFPLVAEKIEHLFPSEFNQLIGLIKSVKIFCLKSSLHQLYFTFRNYWKLLLILTRFSLFFFLCLFFEGIGVYAFVSVRILNKGIYF